MNQSWTNHEPILNQSSESEPRRSPEDSFQVFLAPTRKVCPGGLQKAGNCESWKAFKKRRTNYQKTYHLELLSSSAVKLPKLYFYVKVLYYK